MYRLITEVYGKLNEGSCGPPFKIVHPADKSRTQQPDTSPKKFDVVENYGELHLYRDSQIAGPLNMDSELPFVRSNMVLVLGLSEACLDEVVGPLLKRKAEVNEIEILKDRLHSIYLLVVFKQLPASE